MRANANRGLLVALLLAVTSFAAPAAGQEVRHIILFIGDGMQLEQEIATSRYLTGRDEALSFHRLPYQGAVATWDVSAYNRVAAQLGMTYSPLAIIPTIGYDPARGGLLPYPPQIAGIDNTYFVPGGGVKPVATDSASAATAWATGFKTDDGNIAWLPGDPANGALPTIAEILRSEKGFSIGVVSTVPFSHATPAAHVSHNPNRNNYVAIADEILKQTKPEVVIGGGHPGWSTTPYMSTATYDAFQNGTYSADYVFVERAAGADGTAALLAASDAALHSGKKLFGLFGGPAGNFESPIPLDQPGDPQVLRATDENPLLKDCVDAALRVLSRDPDGFFVMFEQGDIDWAAHANDFGRIVGTVWDLDEAVQAAIAYIDRPGDDVTWGNTLLLVTADHATGYLRLNPDKPLGLGDLPAETAPTPSCPDTYSATLCPEYPDDEVAFSTTYHANELTRLYARGHAVGHINQYEGAWYPCTSILDNTQLFYVMLNAAGVFPVSGLNTVPQPKACEP